jgi:hypothetical protein
MRSSAWRLATDRVRRLQGQRTADIGRSALLLPARMRCHSSEAYDPRGLSVLHCLAFWSAYIQGLLSVYQIAIVTPMLGRHLAGVASPLPRARRSSAGVRWALNGSASVSAPQASCCWRRNRLRRGLIRRMGRKRCATHPAGAAVWGSAIRSATSSVLISRSTHRSASLSSPTFCSFFGRPGVRGPVNHHADGAGHWPQLQNAAGGLAATASFVMRAGDNGVSAVLRQRMPAAQNCAAVSLTRVAEARIVQPHGSISANDRRA